jgi:Tol biopolymer transport system component
MDGFSGSSLKRLLVTLAACAALGAWMAPGAGAFGVFGVKQNGGAGFLSVSDDARYVVWETSATNLSPDDPDTTYDVYVRDTQTGITVLASRATGATGVKANGESRYPSISGDGRYVTFMSVATNLDSADTDAQFDIYVRDLQTDTTELVSRPTGTGPKASALNSWYGRLSHDGRYVVFGSNQVLDPAAAASGGDIYVRDTELDTTILASRASGAAGAGGNAHSTDPAISADGTKVAFGSYSSNLATGDTDAVHDIFVRDIVADTTTLVSRATGAAGAKANAISSYAALSGDGRVVAFASQATNLGGDTDTILDVFARDVQAATTTLVSRATGATGVKGNANSGQQGIDHHVSGDGNRIAFRSAATNLGDTDSTPSLFVRDLQAATTTLASRASGATGASSLSTVDSFSLAEDGRYVAFVTGQLDPAYDPDFAGDVYIRDLQDEVTYLESRGAPIYVRPKGASPLRVPLVPAFEECTAPNREHGPPLAYPSCNPPGQVSDHVTIGTPDYNAKSLNFTGSVRLVAISDNVSTAADEANMKLQVTVTDIRARPGLADYTGELDARLPLRLTDRSNGPSAAETGTTEDADFRVAVPCVATAETTIGSACSVNTSPNAIAPGAIKGGRRAIWALDQVRVFDGGADGMASTAGDNTLFAVQGLMVP